MKIKYFNQDGTETIVDVDQKPDGTIIVPRDLVVPCGCKHDPVNVKSGMWPAAFLFSVCIAGVVVIVWRVLEAFGG